MLKRLFCVTLIVNFVSPAWAGELVHLGNDHATVRARQRGRRFHRLSFYLENGGNEAAMAYLRAFPKGASVTAMPVGERRPLRVPISDPKLRLRLRHTLVPPMHAAYLEKLGVLVQIKPDDVQLGHVRSVSGKQEIAFVASGYRTGGKRKALARLNITPEGKIEILDLKLGWLDSGK